MTGWRWGIFLFLCLTENSIVFAQSCAPPNTSLAAWWPGEGNAMDVVGGNNGSLSGGVTFPTGEVGQAFSFDGSTGYVDIPNSPVFNPTGPFAVECWIKAATTQAAGQFLIVDKMHGFTDGTGWGVQGETDGRVTFFYGTGGPSGDPSYFTNSVTTLTSVLDNQWHHLAGVFTGTNLQIYLDGGLQNSLTESFLPANNARDVEIGRSWGGGSPTRYFNGLIDEVSYYTNAISAGVIAAIYQAGALGKCRTNTPAVNDVLFGQTLWIEGGLFNNHSNLVTSGFANYGAVRMESINGGYSSDLTITNGEFTNGSGGVVNVNSGSGGERVIQGNMLNQGTFNANFGMSFSQANTAIENEGPFNIAPNVTVSVNGQNQIFAQNAGMIDNEGQMFFNNDAFIFDGGSAIGNPLYLENCALSFGSNGTNEAEFIQTGNGSTLSGNISFGQSLTIEGDGTGSHTTLIASNGFTNSGILALESRDGGYTSALTIPSGMLVNESSGVMAVLPGAGGPRAFTGNLFNLGEVDIEYGTIFGQNGAEYHNQGLMEITSGQTLQLSAASQTFSQEAGLLQIDGALAVNNTVFNYEGGEIAGANGIPNLVNCQLNLAPAAINPAVFWQTGSGSTLTGDIKPHQTIWIRGSGAGSHTYFVVTNGFANSGLLRLESIDAGYDTYFYVNTGVFTNRPVGEVDINGGAGGGRQWIGNLLNQGAFNINDSTTFNAANGVYENDGNMNIAPGQTLNINGQNQVFNQNAGVLANNGAASFTSMEFNYNGGSITGIPYLIDCLLNLGPVATNAMELWVTGSSGSMSGDIKAGQTIWLRGSGAGSHTYFSVTNGFANNGTFRLESVDAGYDTFLTIANGLFTNGPTGLVNINPGAGGNRQWTGSVFNQGIFNINDSLELAANDGRYDNYGLFMVAPGQTLTIAGGASQIFNQVSNSLDLEGAAQWYNTTLTLQGGSFQDNGPFNLYSGIFNYDAGAITQAGSMTLVNTLLNLTPGGTSPVVFCLTGSGSSMTGDVQAGQTVWMQGSTPGGFTYLVVTNGFANHGTLRLESINAGYDTFLTVSNGGLTNAPSGVVNINGGAGGNRQWTGNLVNQGAFNINQTLPFSTPSGVYENDGSFRIAPGQTVTINGQNQVFSQNSGTLEDDGAMTLPSIQFNYNGGSIVGIPYLINSLLNLGPAAVNPMELWLTGSGASMTGDIKRGQTIWVRGSTPGGFTTFVVTNGFANHGTLRLESVDAGYDTFFYVNSGTLTNGPDGLLTINAGAGGGRMLRANLLNQGALNVNDSTTMNYPGAVYENQGQFTVAAGQTLTLNAASQTFSQSANIDLEGSAAWNNTIFNQNGGTFEDNGAFTLSSGIFNYDGGVITQTGSIYLINSLLNLGSGAGSPVAFWLTGSGSSVTGDIKPGQTVWIRGSTPGGFTTINITNGFVNNGALRLESVDAGYDSFLYVNNGVLTNGPAGSITINSGAGGGRVLNADIFSQGSVTVNYSSTVGKAEGSFVNQGPIKVAAGQTLALAGSYTQTAGSLELDGAAVSSPTPLAILGGALTGAGTVLQTVTNGGSVTPGNGLTVAGNYNQISAGSLNIVLGGTATGQSTRLSVTGTAQVAGNLSVTLANGFVPTNGNSFTVLTGSAVAGFFTGFNLPPLPNGLSWNVSYPAGAVVISIPAAGTAGNLHITGSVNNTQNAPVAGVTVYAYVDPDAATNAIQNGSFEFPSDNGSSYIVYNPGDTNIPGWTVTPDGPMDISTGFLGAAEDGGQYFDPSGSGGQNGGLTQTFPTVAGTAYHLTFYHGSYQRSGLNPALRVTLGGVTNYYGEAINGQGSFNWTQETIPFTAASNTASVTFVGLANYDANDAFVDNVQVYPANFGQVYSGTTDSNGNYVIAVPDGTWQVNVAGVTSLGYTSASNQTVAMNGTNAIVNFVLSPYSGQYYTVAVSSVPPAAATVTGSGSYPGQSTVTATAAADTNAPWIFVNWLANGLPVSTNLSYTFFISSDTTLTANFILPVYQVSTSNNPAAGGTVAGGGTFSWGATNMLTATGNFGYGFDHWSDGNGNLVFTNPVLSIVVVSNNLLVANYLPTNLTHIVTTATTPAGVAPVTGPGSYSNGQTAQFFAPTPVTNGPIYYSLTQFTLNGVVVSTSPSFNYTFSTTDPGNIAVVANYATHSVQPLIVAASANIANPVGAVTNLILSFQFDRSMNPADNPLVVLTNSGGLQPAVNANGAWSQRVFANDTYSTPPITLVQGTDGSNQALISGGMDLGGQTLALTNVLTLLVDATPPVISSITVNPGALSAVVSWNTSEPANSTVDFGFDTNYTRSTGLDPQTVSSHLETLGNLSPARVYHYRVRSADLAGNVTTSGDASFTTLGVPDLQVTGLSVAGALLSGTTLTISWADTNTGSGPTFASWQDQLVVSNTITGVALLSQTYLYDSTASGNIAAGAAFNRQATLRLPDGANGAGVLEIMVVVNVQSNEFELTTNNNFATNLAVSSLNVYPDLQVTNLQVTSGPVQSGSTVTIAWDETNSGTGPVTNSFDDEIAVSNVTRAVSLVDGSLLYDPGASGIISAGSSVHRQFSFSLPNTLAGAGLLQVTVNADSTGSIFEFNAAGSAESNNSEAITVTSTLSPPQITLQPADQTAECGSGAILTVTANGVAPLSYQWYLGNGQPLANATNASFATASLSLGPSITFYVTVTDGGGSSTSRVATVNVRDTTPPVVTLVGNAITNISCLSSFVDPGATAFDACAGVVPVTIHGSVPAGTLGSYLLSYTATDASSNTATVFRTVNVGSATPPVIVLKGASPMTVECHGVFNDPGVTTSDTCAGVVTVRTTSTLDVNSTGSYMVTYVASDPSGNAATNARVVNVVDTTPPTLTLNGAAALAIGVGQPFNDPGAIAFDVCAGTLAVTTNGTVNTNTPGTYALTYTAADPSGNAATNTRSVTVMYLPDIIVGSVTAPPKAQAGVPLEVSWTITNRGAVDFTGTFHDTVFLAGNPLGTNPVSYGQFTFKGTIAAGHGIVLAGLINPPAALSGNQWAVVQTDANSLLAASNGETNTSAISTNAINFSPESFPNLEVTSIHVPVSAISGQNVTITWVVTNAGSAAASIPWSDAVYLSGDGKIDLTTKLLGAAPNASFLNPGDSYQNSLTVTLPQKLEGDFYVVVQADSGSAITESTHTNNVLTAGPMEIDFPPLPDLEVGEVLAPGNSFSGQVSFITWTVVNGGDATTPGGSWYDSVYLSTTNIFDTNAVFLGTSIHSGALAAGGSYTVTNFPVLLPVGISGTYYFLVGISADNVWELSTDNNLGAPNHPTQVLLTPPPDLAVSHINVLGTPLASHSLEVLFTVTNEGSSITPNSGWQDAVYLCPTTNFDPAAALVSAVVSHDQPLETGNSYTNAAVFTVPNGLAGVYYLFVQTDPQGTVFELNKTNNVAFVPVTIQSILPNLVVTGLRAPPSVVAGSAGFLGWTVANQGSGDTAIADWNDQVVLSPTTNPANGVVILNAPHTGLLLPGQSYSVTNQFVQIPYAETEGVYYLFIRADADNAVYEGALANKISNPLAITVINQPADLAASPLAGPAQAQAGSVITVTWFATNLGPSVTHAGYWDDTVYLSLHPASYFLSNAPDTNDIRLGSIARGNDLGVNDSYSNSLTAAVPGALAGNYTAYVQVDSGARVIQDSSRFNNIGFLPVPMQISPQTVAPVIPVGQPAPAGPLPDLAVTNVVAPGVAYGGQSMTMTWTVTNLGQGNATGDWNDAVYLSLDQFLDLNSAIYLGRAERPQALSNGQSYTVTSSFTVPSSANGYYYAFVVADAFQTVSRLDTNEENVDFADVPVLVTAALPVDFVVTSVQAPTNGLSGQLFDIVYQVSNEGSNAANGTWTDSIYISATNVWSPSDLLIGHVTEQGTIAPGSNYTGTLFTQLPGVGTGNFYIIVRPDILNNLNENVTVNHAGASSNSVAVDVPALALGVPQTSATLMSAPQYYKVTVGAGQALSFQLRSVSSNSANQLYVRYGALPDTAHFDFISSDPITPNQQITVPATQAGVYYVMALADYVPAGEETYTIEASVLPFSIDSITPSRGGNAGSVTVEIQGGQFGSQVTASLVNSNNLVIPGAIRSEPNATVLYATFNLLSAPTGPYDVKLSQPGSSVVVLPNGFTVTAGLGPKMAASLSLPGAVRPGFTYSVFLNYGNSGDEDLPAQLYFITNNAGMAMSLSPQGAFATTPVQVLGVAQAGPGGVLPPGAQYSIPIYFQVPLSAGAHSIFKFDLHNLIPNGAPVDWGNFIVSQPLPGIPADAWPVITNNIIAQAGPTTARFLQALDDDATLFSQQNRVVYDLTALLVLEADKDMGLIEHSRAIGQQRDAYLPSQQLAMAFDRQMPIGISHRFKLGPFGRGWSHNFSASLAFDAAGVIDITQPDDTHQLFYQQDDQSWVPGSGNFSALQPIGGGAYLVTDKDGRTAEFDAQGRLVSLQEPNGNQITLTYASGNLSAITHSDGQQFTLAYNGSGRVASLTDSAGRVTQYQYDASGEHLLAAVLPGNVVVAYTYYPAAGGASDHALQTVTLADGTQRSYTYDSLGRIAATSLGNGAMQNQYTYDTTGNVHIANAANEVRTLQLGDRGQYLKDIDPLGNSASLNYNTNYELMGVVESAGQSGDFAYDGSGRATAAVSPLGQQVSLTYTNFSHVAAIRTPRAQVNTFAYDARGNALLFSYPDGSAESYSYDALGSVTNYSNRRGQSIRCARDQFGQVTNKTYPDGRVIGYQFDTRGFLTNMNDSAQGVTSIQYDERGFPTNILYPDGSGFNFSYDGEGKRTRRAGFDGYVLNYSYDSVGRLAAMTDGASNLLAQYTYDPEGHLSAETKGNGTTTGYNYDLAGRIIALTNSGPGGSAQSFFNYTYDSSGRRATMTTTAGVTSYQYDAMGQLTMVQYPNGRQVAYNYDPSGNRTTVTDNGTNTSYTANPLDQYSQAGNAALTYDLDGNLTRRTDSSGTTLYQYDSDNFLTNMVTPSNGVWQFSYDGLGHRNAIVSNGVTNRLLLDPAGLVDVAAEYDGSGSLVARYVKGIGLVSRTDGAGNVAYYSYDALGNTRQLTAHDGSLLNSYDYDAFGATTASTGSTPNEYQFVGRYGIRTAGPALSFMRSRYYSPDLGRFTSVDPLRFGGGLNLMTYAGNNPVCAIDLLGTEYYDSLTGDQVNNDGTYVDTHEAETVALNQYVHDNLAPHGTIDIGFTAKAGGGTTGGILINLENGDVHHYTGVTVGSPSVSGFIMWGPSSPTVGANLSVSGNIPGFGGQAGIGTDGSSTSTGWEVGPVIGPPSIGGAVTFVSPPMFNLFPTRPDNTQNDGDYDSQVLVPGDPNDKAGPIGFGPNGLVGALSPLSYTISFINAATNSAPVHNLSIIDQLDPNLDPRTVRLSEIVFGSTTITLPPNRSFLQTNLVLASSVGPVEVQLVAGINVVSGQLFWTLTAIDPATGQAPTDPRLGFLPPDDAAHDGEGRVTYSVTPVTAVATGTIIVNAATITFDNNPSIVTPAAVNTIDAGMPQSEVTIGGNAGGASFLVSWAGQDNGGLSGLADYDVYVSDDGAPFSLWLTNTTLTSAPYTGQPGHIYSFYSIAFDNAGNVQAAANSTNAIVALSGLNPPALAVISNFMVFPNHLLTFTNVTAYDAAPPLTLTYSLGAGAPAGALVDPQTGVFSWTPSPAQAGMSNTISVIVTDDGILPLSATQTFNVAVLNDIRISVGSASVFAGQNVTVPISLSTATNLNSLAFLLNLPHTVVSNATLQQISAGLNAVTFNDAGSDNYQVVLSAPPGQKIPVGTALAQLSFGPSPAASAYVALRPAAAVGVSTLGVTTLGAEVDTGRIFIVGAQPVLDLVNSDNTLNLVLYGNPGSQYEIQSSASLGAGIWTTLFSIDATNISTTVAVPPLSSASYYRAVFVGLQP